MLPIIPTVLTAANPRQVGSPKQFTKPDFCLQKFRRTLIKLSLRERNFFILSCPPLGGRGVLSLSIFSLYLMWRDSFPLSVVTLRCDGHACHTPVTRDSTVTRGNPIRTTPFMTLPPAPLSFGVSLSFLHTPFFNAFRRSILKLLKASLANLRQASFILILGPVQNQDSPFIVDPDHSKLLKPA